MICLRRGCAFTGAEIVGTWRDIPELVAKQNIKSDYRG